MKPAKQYCHDWMHALMVSGVMNVVLWKLFVALSAVMGDIYTQVYNYIQTWGGLHFAIMGLLCEICFWGEGVVQ